MIFHPSASRPMILRLIVHVLWIGLLGQTSVMAIAHAHSPCPSYRDAIDIPHFKAESKNQGWQCLGYFHGLDRAWQSDQLRRIVLGRRAEVEGLSAIKDDLKMRLFNFAMVADHIVATLDASGRSALDSYAQGWNQGMHEARDQGLIYELKAWPQTMDEWTPRDSVALLLLQSFDQTRKSFEVEFSESKAITHFGEHASSITSERGTPWETTVIKSDEVETRDLPTQPAPVDSVQRNSSLRDFFARVAPPSFDFLGASDFKGSNNWVVAPSHNETGHAVLMNDPHLDLKTPSFWYWAEIKVQGQASILGATLPGGPLFASGLNENLAWGLTNSYFDVADIAYIPRAQLPDLESFRPTVHFKFLGMQIPFFFKSFEKLPRGYPVLPVDAPSGKVALLKWSGYHLEGKDFAALLDLPFARSAKQADLIFGQIGFPSWNYVFADTQGQIGHRVIGKLPRRESAGFGIAAPTAPAEIKAFRDWDFLSADEAPHLFNPSRGYIASANQQSWPENTPFSAGRAQVSGFRAYRIENWLKSIPRHSLQDLRDLQCDVQAVDAEFLRPPLLQFLDDLRAHDSIVADTYDDLAARALKDWDGFANPDCTGCLVYRFFVHELKRQWELGEVGLFHVLTEPDRYEIASADFELLIRKAWSRTLAELQRIDATHLPTLGKIHEAPFRHFSGRAEWNPRNPLVTGGDDHSVNPGSWDEKPKIEHRYGASMRTQIELSKPPKIWMQLAGIQKDLENPDLRAAGSAWSKWRDCALTAMPFPGNWNSPRASHSSPK